MLATLAIWLIVNTETIRIKSCGGMIAPDAQSFLKKHNISIPTSVLEPIQPSFVQTFEAELPFSRKYKRNYINVNREAFDRFLLEALQADTYFSYQVNTIEYSDTHYIINNELKCKILVGADGARSKVAKKFFPNMRIRRYASIQDEIKPQITQNYTCYFDEKVSDYYGWSIPKNNSTLVGYAIKPKNALKIFEDFKARNGLSSSTKRIRREGTVILRPYFFHKVHCSKNLFLIGEAGGYISPSSAEGISYAFKSAKYLAESNFNEDIFRKKMRSMQINIFYKNVKSFFQNTKFLRKIIMRLSILR